MSSNSTHLFPGEVGDFVSIPVAYVSMLRCLFHHEVNVTRAVEGVCDVDDLRVDHPAEAFLHREVEGLQWDEAWHDIHGYFQVFHCGETVADVHREGIISLRETDESLTYSDTWEYDLFHDSVNDVTINLDGCRDVEDAPLINVVLSEGVNVVENWRGCAV